MLHFARAEAQLPHIVFVIGENEYHTWETLPEFSRNELAPRGFKCSLVTASTRTDDNVFTNFNVIKEADLLILSVRRRTPPAEMMTLVRAHLNAGKPLVGIRTAIHAFDAPIRDSLHENWPHFDTEIFGCLYQGHYSNVKDAAQRTQVRPVADADPILIGIPTNEWTVSGSLYKCRRPAATVKVLMTGRLPNDPAVSEPVTWINTANDRRVFYTSLGVPDDFRQPAFRQLLLNGIFWALARPIPALNTIPAGSSNSSLTTPAETPRQEHPLPPKESLGAFTVPSDLEIEQVLAEPRVRQPVFINFDERGRLWVVEYLQYPHPAGLKMLSHDEFWRAVYDRVPPPPPRHFVGADRIVIFEDTRGNGQFDRQKVFVEGLNIVTALAKGRGGVWVLNPPYLLFYADKDQDDVPDGDPQVLLSGFGLEDTHSVVNSLRWGPDGWLYACQGSTVTAQVLRPGIDQQPIARTVGQQIWRYHPETKKFEVFSEGGGNAFGCELDTQGRIFSGHNGGNTRGFHYLQGAYLQKGFEKHGPLSNPYAFGYFPPMPHPDVDRFTHNFILYDGAALPDRYKGKLLGIEPLQGRVVESQITAEGSTFKTMDIAHPLTTTDPWFRPVDIKVGPDGAIYLADWYDDQVNHYRNHEGRIDKSNGRIYRLKAKGARPVAPFDLNKLTSNGLLELLAHTNKWFRQEALRVVADRRDNSLVPRLMDMLRTNSGQLALESLWALNLSGGFSDRVAEQTLNHTNPFVRLWTVRLLGDKEVVSPHIAKSLVTLAAQEPNVEVRAQLACSAKRLPAASALPIIRALLARNEDLDEKRIPLLLWWALESKCERDSDAVTRFFQEPEIWRVPLVQAHILERVMRRFALAGTRHDLLVCAKLLRLSPGPEQTAKLMSGFELGLKGRSQLAFPDELVAALEKSGAKSAVVGLRRGDAAAVAQAIADIANPNTPLEKRLENIEVLGETKQVSALPTLLSLIADPKTKLVHSATITALQHFDAPEIAAEIIRHFDDLHEQTRPMAIGLLSSRPAWARALLEAIDGGRISKPSITPDVLLKLKKYQQKEIARLVKKHFSGERVPTSAEMQARIDHYSKAIRADIGDPYAGQTIFTASCATCHKLFGAGGQIGPDLTPYQRDDLDTMLLGLINPSAEIREGYESYMIETKDDRTLSGFLADQDDRTVVLRGSDGLNTVLPRDQISEMKASALSLMPAGLLESLTDEQVRNLFAYLRSTQPLVKRPQPDSRAASQAP